MPSFRAIGLLIVAAPVIALACSLPGGDQPENDRADGKAPSQIIGGSLDTTHTAVVAVLGNNFSCSGTIIQVANGQGYVLTAAHCCVPGNLPSVVVIGNDYNTGTQFPIVGGSVTTDSCYANCAGSTDDVCMLRFSGATGATPVIPAMTPQTDNLTVGAAITYVGYGITSSPPGGFNSKRRSVAKNIGGLTKYFVDESNPAASGTCEGDSGGPGLVLVNGVETVACVTSFGDQACTQLGTSIRTNSVYTNFIAPYLQDQPPIQATCPVDSDCNLCISNSTNPNCGGGCTTSLSACQNDTDCAALLNCYNGCATQACEDTCSSQHLPGLSKYLALVGCICGTPCETACGTNGFCAAPHCGIEPPSADAACTSCTEGSCCAEALACSADSKCKSCFTFPTPAPACATNAAALAYYQCITSDCPTCTLKDPTKGSASTTTTTGAGGGSSNGSGGAGGDASAGGAGPSTTSGMEPPTTTETGCTCRTSSSNDERQVPIVVALALGIAAASRLHRRVSRAR